MTRAQEEETMNLFEPMLAKMVKSFRRKCRYRHSSPIEDDLMQEARIAFLSHIRAHPDEPGRCCLDVRHALYEAVRRDYPVYIPYGAFNREAAKGLWVDDLDAVEIASTEEGFEGVEVDMDFSTALRELDRSTQELIQLKRAGMSSREAGRYIGMSDVQVCRRLASVRASFTL